MCKPDSSLPTVMVEIPAQVLNEVNILNTFVFRIDT